MRKKRTSISLLFSPKGPYLQIGFTIKCFRPCLCFLLLEMEQRGKLYIHTYYLFLVEQWKRKNIQMSAQISYKSEGTYNYFFFLPFQPPLFWKDARFLFVIRIFCHVTLGYMLSSACSSAARSQNPVLRPQGRLVITILPLDCVDEICSLWR